MFDGRFITQKRVGEIGEEKVLNYLLKNHKVDDKRDSDEYRHKDIDFVVDDTVSLEVKTDYNISRTDNIYIETYKGGWFEKCAADYLCIYSPQVNLAYILDYRKLKSILSSSGREIHHYDADTGLMVPAVLVPLYDARIKGALTQTISL